MYEHNDEKNLKVAKTLLLVGVAGIALLAIMTIARGEGAVKVSDVVLRR